MEDQNYLAAVDGNEAKAQLDSKGLLTFEVDGTPVELAEEDLLIEMVKQEGFVTEADNGVTVVLDTNLSEELLEEGFVREVVSKIQSMRKEAGFEVTDSHHILLQRIRQSRRHHRKKRSSDRWRRFSR